MSSKSINIINVPSDIGSIYAGKSKAPAAFKSAGLQDKLKEAGYHITETDAVTPDLTSWKSSTRGANGARNEEPIVEACQKIRQTVSNALSSQSPDTIQFILGGECMYCPAILSAYWKHLEGTGKRIGILYMDADADLNTPAGLTGTIAGMTLTHMTLREGALDSMRQFSRSDGAPVVDNSNIVLFGTNVNSEANARDQLGYLFDNDFRVVTSTAVQRSPIERAKEALRWLEERVDCILVHLDVDAIDPGDFPLCHLPNWTGLGFEEAMSAVKVFLGSEKTVAFSVAEVNPDHDPGLEMTRRLVDHLVEGLGARRS